ncbi:Sin-like protein conserved region-domain-containing protein [Xylariaceae sp. FL0804]|nr:Sin-like protein conserved region-domain-containing protein [Xylariaceae sp. FL0804]
MDLDEGAAPAPTTATSSPAAVAAVADRDRDADPVVASYAVYANAAVAAPRRLLVLQHPNKQGAGNAPYAAVGEVRTKARAGMVEVDVPLGHAHADYDRDKGQRWGGALARSLAGKGGGSHGLAGGFGLGVSSTGRGGPGGGGAARGARAKPLDDVDLMTWNEAVRQDKVLRTQTLGGQLPSHTEDRSCRWMVGVFKNNQLHLTPAAAVIQLRPQLHHLDAAGEQDRLSRGAAREGGPAGAGAPPGAAAAGGNQEKQAAPPAARAIHMSIKSAGGAGSDEPATETMTDRLRAVQLEKWARLKYEDEDSDRAWRVFHGSLVYRGANTAAAAGDDGKDKDKDKDKGKGKEKATATAVASAAVRPDVTQQQQQEQQQHLKTRWGGDDFLRAVSGMRDGPDGGEVGVKRRDEVVVDVKTEEPEPTTAAAAAAAAAPKRAPAARGRGNKAAATAAPAAAAAGSKRTANSKGKSVAFKGSAMDLD